MSRRRSRRGRTVDGSQPHASPSAVVPPGSPAVAPVSPGANPKNPKVNAPLHVTDAFKALFDKAASKAKSEMAPTGKIRSMAVFVYEDETGNPEASTTKTASLVWNSESQKETLVKRIREKALMEHAAAVMVLTEAEPGARSGPQRPGVLTLSCVAPGMSLSARVDYKLSNDAKSITSWEMRYLERPIRSPFLDSIFPNPSP